ncbi:MAG TPA: hypothetical protein VFR49_15030 [Solirubrobacteraceae bacterium]|nr:hypothetical protein [Solirubrobacteraceae bacterium]
MSRTLERLVEELRADGGLLAAALDGDPRPPPAAATGGPAGPPGPGAIAAAGPRAAVDPAEYELLIEAIHEGYLLHYGEPRILAGAETDLRLLAGDRLFAAGLERLVALGDVPAVRELADVISLCALVHARGAGELAESVWTAGARAVGWGATDAYAEAKALLMAGDARGPAALRAVAGATVTPTG